jgi:hypothetical protein
MTGPTAVETRDADALDKHRLAVSYTGKGYAPLLPLIEALNRW